MQVGILGGGQLARMMAEAGGPLGLSFTFLDPSAEACAKDLGVLQVGAWNDARALQSMSACERVTADFENVPAEVLAQLSAKTIVRPPAAAFAAAQDRLAEKRLLESLGIPTASIAAVFSRPDLVAAVEKVGFPAVLKTRRLGYDGKGQVVLRMHEDLEPAWQQLGGHDLILEAWVDFDFECAQTAVRSADGEIRCYPLTRTVHHDGVLRLAKSPAAAPPDLADRAERAVTTLLQALDYVGCLTLELFASESEMIANEFAPRPHNSAHWTIEGAVTSQFENHLRAVCDLPLGATSARGVALMFNWLGSMPDRDSMLAVPGLGWHDYHKTSRPGRKVGHATLIAEDEQSLVQGVELLRPMLDRQTADLLAAVPSGPCG